MSMSDPISDMLTRIRNAQLRKKSAYPCLHPSLKVAIAAVLKDEGYVDNFAVRENGVKATHWKSASNITPFVR